MMTVHSATRTPLARTVVLLAGASVFAYLFGVLVHEMGHYAASVALGVPEPAIVLHPLDISENIYGGDISQALGTPWRRAISGAAGPLLNLIVAGGVSLLVWRRRSPSWLPLLIWGGIALLQESVGMIIGLVDYPDVSSDWSDVMVAGVPPPVIGMLAVVAIVVGTIWMLLLLPVASIRREDAVWAKLVAFLAGIPLLMLGAVLYLELFGSRDDSLTWYVLQNRQIALAASIGLVAAISALHRPLFPFVDRISHADVAHVTWRDAGLAAGLCAAVFIGQLVLFN